MTRNKTSFNFPEGEILLFDKPYEWSSFDVVNKIRLVIRRKTGINKIKIGHAGTLDPLATGLLILCTGKFTKKIEEIQVQDKEYTGTFYIGKTTPSFDLETEVDKEYPTGHIDEEKILSAAKRFAGDIEQTPPVFSAKRLKGKRLYEYARKGEEVDIPSKVIKIYSFEIKNVSMPLIDFRVQCSKGTYIRSLARDFGHALGSGAFLNDLRRTASGDYTIDEAYSIKEFESLF